MKTRTGFVSNSSSSSFCIYGVCKDANKILNSFPQNELFEKLKVSNEDELDEWVNDNGIEEALYSLMPKDVEFHTLGEYGDNQAYIGRSWSDINDDETGAQFKASVQKIIGETFGITDKKDFGTYEEAWYG